jgi:D-aminopeptidase
MRVALSADMEGVSQLDDWRAVLAFDPAYWREGRAQMEAEVAAAARGLLSATAERGSRRAHEAPDRTQP